MTYPPKTLPYCRAVNLLERIKKKRGRKRKRIREMYYEIPYLKYIIF